MADEAERLTLEERRLALEERKWADEFSLRKLELETKVRDSTWTAKLFSPLTATIMAGILTVAGSVTATLIQNAYSLRLEREKFASSKTLDTQKQQHEMILKMIGVEDVEQARKNLRFLAETELIADKKLAERLLAAKETPLIRPPSGSTPVTTPSPVTAEEVRRLVSEEAINMMISFELGGGREVYESKGGRPVWTGGASGTVIGIGYDVGRQPADKIKQDWAPYLSQADIDRLAAVSGITGSASRSRAQELSDISVPWDAAVAVFSGVQLARLATRLEQNVPNARDLPPHSYGALLSLVYSRGFGFTTTGDRFSEMREIRALMGARKFAEIPEQLRSMKRLWPESKILQTLRETEARLFERGLTE